MWNIYIEIIIAMRTTEKPELLHVANMKSPHSRVSLAATARSRTNQQEPPSAVLPVSYSAFIGVVTLQINDPVLAWGTQTLTPPVTKLLWPFESRRNTTPGICFSLPPGSLRFCFHTKFCLCHWAKHQNDTAVLWCERVQLCTVAQSNLFSLEPFLLVIWPKEWDRKGRDNDAGKREILRAAIKGEKKKVRNE